MRKTYDKYNFLIRLVVNEKCLSTRTGGDMKMKTVNRKRAMIVCLVILIIMLFESITNTLFLHADNMSLVYGVVMGWALRETLSSKQEDEE